MKILSFLLALSTLCFAGLSYANHLRVQSRNDLIHQREATIDGYHKIFDAIIRHQGIDPDRLSEELHQDFELSAYHGDQIISLEIRPKNGEVNRSRIWDYMGGFVVEFDKDQQLSYVGLYKP